MDAVLLCKSRKFLITNSSEIIPWLRYTKHVNLPVIIDNADKEEIKVFKSAVNNEKLLCALKIVTTAEIYDKQLYNSLSELNINRAGNVSVQLSNSPYPIYFGNDKLWLYFDTFWRFKGTVGFMLLIVTWLKFTIHDG